MLKKVEDVYITFFYELLVFAIIRFKKISIHQLIFKQNIKYGENYINDYFTLNIKKKNNNKEGKL